jgi:general secretion pathway protein D
VGALASPTAQASSGTGRSVFGRDVSIQPAVEINGVVVRAGASDMAEIERLILDLDVRRPQVLIEAAIVEITGSSAETLGAQLGLGGNVDEGALAATSFSLAGPSLRAILSALGEPGAQALAPEGLTAGASTGDGFSILVQALSQSSKANLLSTPSVMTLDNRSAEIVVGQNVPFRTGSFTTIGNARDPFTTIEREDVGVTLEVLPRLYDGDVIRLEVRQEVSSLVNTTVAGASDLITNQRSIETTVLADDGETIVLGGLITDDSQTTRSRTPVLGRIPVLGRLFGSSQETTTRRTLFVFLRPTILRDGDDASKAATLQYEKLRDREREADPSRLLPADPAPRLPPPLPDDY